MNKFIDFLNEKYGEQRINCCAGVVFKEAGARHDLEMTITPLSKTGLYDLSKKNWPHIYTMSSQGKKQNVVIYFAIHHHEYDIETLDPVLRTIAYAILEWAYSGGGRSITNTVFGEVLGMEEFWK